MADLAFILAGTVIENLGSVANEEISLAWGVKDDIKKLEKTTAILRAVLLDAEKKQERDEQLGIWLERLTVVFHDAQDVLDEFDCEVLRSQVMKEYGSLVRKVRRFFSRSNPLVFRFSIAHRIKEIRQKLDDVAKEMAKFQLISTQLNQEQSNLMLGTKEMMSHSYVEASEVIGRDCEKAEILDMVLDQDHNNISVISIIGIGGLGKTTLAKSVYNDDEIVRKFDLTIWVCVSLDFNVTKLVREIIVSITQTKMHDIDNLSLNRLQISLRDTLENKKFLLVLDDVWNEDPMKWHELKELLTVGSTESKIIVTTRNSSVASIMNAAGRSCQLKGLSEEDSMSLFFKYAFGDDKEQAEKYPKLKDIGREIVKKCGGVPLALKTLGSLLHLKTEAEWRFVRDNKIWELEQKQGHILPALRISYDAMSPCLKQCFAYCSIFPEDSLMHSFELIPIWMALGILQSPNNKVELEDIGELHFIKLFARSFFQVENDGGDNYGTGYLFTVHDLIHNLACSITQGVCSIVKSDDGEISDSIRYLRIFLNVNNLTILHKFRNVRSIHVNCTIDQKDELVQLFLSTCIFRFKYLRVFDLGELSFEVLPSSIGTVKHLRYLNLNNNKMIKKLPDSICKLQSLQTLLLGGCEELEELPRDIRNLVSLRALVVTTKQKFFAEGGVGRLKSIRLLYILDCKNLRALPDDLRYCTTLRTLLVGNCEQLNLASGPIDEVVELTLRTFVIGYLPETTALPQWLQQATKTLQSLHIEYCPKLATLPEWLSKLTSLEKLVINECHELLSLPEGMERLTSLTYLKIAGCEALEKRCERDVGEDWPKIAHIPNIVIGDD